MQPHKMHMNVRQFRIGDLAKELKVKKFVIRFWEKEFGLKSDRSQGGQRFYTLDDLKTFLTIKDLLYNKGFTIAGAKKQLHALLRGEGGTLVDVPSEQPESVSSHSQEQAEEIAVLSSSDAQEAEEDDKDSEETEETIVTEILLVEEIKPLEKIESIEPATLVVSPSHQSSDILTPATMAPCECRQQLESQLNTLKDQLLTLKMQLEQARRI